MGKFNSLLNLRLKSKEPQKEKMQALAERSSKGNLSSFSGIFRVTGLNHKEKENLENLLKDFQEDKNYDIQKDLNELTTITSEVRAIMNQAIILHGERIKKAQTILKNYQEGAFTAWLIATYGNRQTPYNFLQYYEFYSSMPQELHQKIDGMPRQAIYTLASRSGELEKKEEVVKNYEGQSKEELLNLIRNIFPLADKDKRAVNHAAQAISLLKRTRAVLEQSSYQPTEREQKALKRLIEQVQELIEAHAIL